MRKRFLSITERAEQMVGYTTWGSLDNNERDAIIRELNGGGSAEHFAKGGVVVAEAEKFIATYRLANGKTVTKGFATEDERDDAIIEFMMANDVIDVDVSEEKPKKSLFDAVKTVTPPKSSAKKKEVYQIDGIEDDIKRYDQLKAIINNAKSEQEILGGKIKELAKDKFLEVYKETNRKPENFNVSDGDADILFIVMDKYKKVEEGKAEVLRTNGFDGLLEEAVVYKFNTDILEKETTSGETIGDIVSALIMNSDDISDSDKTKLIEAEKTIRIRKGSIDRLMDYDDPETVFGLIEPILALK